MWSRDLEADMTRNGYTWENCNDWPRTVMIGECLLVAFAPDGATGDDDETTEKQDTKSLLFRCSTLFKFMSEVIFPTGKSVRLS